MANPINTPTVYGAYWARTRRCTYWNVIVHVGGENPFLYIRSAWRWADDIFITDPKCFYDIQEFGPKIENAPSPILSKDES